MNRKLNPGLLALAGALLVASAAPLEASPQRDTARSTRPSSSSSASSSGSVSRSSGSQAVSRAPSSSPSRHGASATRPPSGIRGGVVERGERRGGGRVTFHPGFHHHYWHFGFGLGYPWGYYWGPYDYWGPYGWYGYGYGYGPPYGPYRGYGGYPRDARYEEPGAIDLNVKPKRAEVYVDGELVGSAGQFDGFPDYLWLTPGSHEVILYHDGYATQRRVVNVRPVWVVNLRIALESGEALPPEQMSRPLESDGQGSQAWRERP